MAPPSCDLTNASSELLKVPWKGVLGAAIRSVKSKTVPLRGSIRTTLPIVCCRFMVSMNDWTGLQLTPPSVVLDITAGPVY